MNAERVTQPLQVMARFMLNVHMHPFGCWEWTGHRRGNRGYPSFSLKGRSERAHRLAYEHFQRVIPDGHEIDHLCRNILCVHPLHLEAVTHRENMRRGYGWAGQNARKTHCVKGHPLTPDNCYPSDKGYRVCITCARIRAHDFYHTKGKK